MEYTIVRGACDEDLVKEVKRFIVAGWRPQGGVATTLAGESMWCYQAMTRDVRPAPAAGREGVAIVVEALVGDVFRASSPQDEMDIRGRGRSPSEAIGMLILHRGHVLGIRVELPK